MRVDSLAYLLNILCHVALRVSSESLDPVPHCQLHNFETLTMAYVAVDADEVSTIYLES